MNYVVLNFHDFYVKCMSVAVQSLTKTVKCNYPNQDGSKKIAENAKTKLRITVGSDPFLLATIPKCEL